MLPNLVAAWVALYAFTAVSNAQPQGSTGALAGVPSLNWIKRQGGSTSTATTTVSEAATATNGTTACNNSPALCNRNYNNITHMGAHDSAFLRDSSTSFSTAGNQFYNATVALDAGIRLLQAQVHNSSSGNVLELCHTSCALLDGGSLETFLSKIKTWMDENTNEVVTILLVNSDDFSASDFGAVFESSGISKYGYTPTSTTGPISTWPTLQTLIDADTRLMAFVADVTYTSSYPYIMNEFSYMFETAFTVTSLSGFNCTLNRPSTLSSAATAISSGYMPFINHFADTAEILGITIPDVTDISITNSPETNTTGALGLHAETCESQYGIKPTFMMVDFFNVGPSITTADVMNGIEGQTTGRTSVSDAVLTAANSSSDGSVLRSKGAVFGGALALIALVNTLLL